jgi:sugar O-acyltransferase (sialic acid O-acetyltransferase NeuD family)
VLGGFAEVTGLLRLHGPTTYITATGSNSVRRRLAKLADDAGLIAASLVHTSALIGMECDIGAGTCLAPRTVLTRDVRLGMHCIANVGVTVSHDCRIGDFVNLNPGVTICGDVVIGDDCYIGAGTTVIDKVKIGAGTIVGAGAVVVRDLPAGVLAVGVPARVVRHLQTEPPAA